MLYSQDGLGLGHLRRTSSIAAALVRALPDTPVLTITDSPLGQFFGRTPNQDYVKLPSIRKIGPGDWEPLGLPLRFDHVHEVRRAMLHAVATSYRPDLLLVDHMPHGAMGELLPTLEALKGRGGSGAMVVLGLRDVIDAPDVVKRVWSEEGAFDAVEQFYDRVLVYGCQDVFDLGSRYGFAPDVVERMRYTGYACTQSQPRYTNRVRAENIGAENSALVVVTAGGGADAHPMMCVVLEALKLVRHDRPCSAVFVAGPLMPSRLRRDLEQRSKGTPTRVRASVSDPLSYIHAADAVVLMAGYNSSIEVLRAGTPSILVPRAGPSAEQRTRAQLFAERGWARVVDPDDLSPEAIATSLLETLERGAGPGDFEPATAPPLGGLDIAVGHLLDLLGEQHDPIVPLPGLEGLETVPA